MPTQSCFGAGYYQETDDSLVQMNCNYRRRVLSGADAHCSITGHLDRTHAKVSIPPVVRNVACLH